MSSDRSLDTAIEHLYQLPLEEFVQARNDLARQVTGADAARVRQLAKPNIIAWTLNQVYWTRRPVFDRLLASAARMREAQADALRGRVVDLRAAGSDHRRAISEAVAASAKLLEAAGHGATPDALRSLTAAFEALPWADQAGRLVRPPVPSGFAALAGLSIGAPVPAETRERPRPTPAPAARKHQRSGAADADADREREREAEAARKAERDRQQRLKEARARYDAARRDAEKAAEGARTSGRRLEELRAAERDARDRLEQARHALRDGEAAHREALQREMTAARELRQSEAQVQQLQRPE